MTVLSEILRMIQFEFVTMPTVPVTVGLAKSQMPTLQDTINDPGHPQ